MDKAMRGLELALSKEKRVSEEEVQESAHRAQQQAQQAQRLREELEQLRRQAKDPESELSAVKVTQITVCHVCSGKNATENILCYTILCTIIYYVYTIHYSTL